MTYLKCLPGSRGKTYIYYLHKYISVYYFLFWKPFILAVKEVFLLSISKISERKLISGTDILCNLKNTIGHCSILYFVPEHWRTLICVVWHLRLLKQFIKISIQTFKKIISRAWFRSTDLWVMGPARFHCATLLILIDVEFYLFNLFQSDVIASENCSRSYLI